MENTVYKSIYSPRKVKLYKRLAAFLLDAIIFLILFVGFLFLISSIFNVDKDMNTLNDLYIKYNVKILNGDSYVFCDSDTEACKLALANIYKDDLFRNSFINVSKFLTYGPIASVFLSYLIVEFIIPLILKNGSTIGMRIMHIALLSKKGIKVSNIQLFIRFLFGKFIVNGVLVVFGIMYILPFYIVTNNQLITGLTFILICLILNVISVLATDFKVLIPDVISFTLPVDSQEQMFFNSEDELNKAKAKEFMNMEKNNGSK